MSETSKLDEFQEDLELSMDKLDKLCCDLPTVMAEIGELTADAKRAMVRAEELVKTVRSELVLAVAREPNLLGPKIKPIKDNIEAYYRTHPKYTKAKDDWIEKTHDHDVLNGVVFSIQAKKVAIEMLVKLHGMDYFSKPNLKD